MKLVIGVEDGCSAYIVMTGKTEEDIFEKLQKHSEITYLRNDLDHYGWHSFHEEHKVTLCQDDHAHWNANPTCIPRGKISGQFDDLSHLLDAYKIWNQDSSNFMEVVELPSDGMQPSSTKTKCDCPSSILLSSGCQNKKEHK